MLRKGDIVTIQAKVRWDVEKDEQCVSLLLESAINDYLSVSLEAITIFRQELRVGDRVAVSGNDPVTILAIDGDDLFVRDDDGNADTIISAIVSRVDNE